MGTEVRLKASSKSKKAITSGHIITKQYDGGDASLIKKYSRVHVSYSIGGTGNSPLTLQYKIDDNSQWSSLEPEPNNPYVVSVSSKLRFKRTNGKLSTAELIIPGKAKGRSISLRFSLDQSLIGLVTTDFNDFILSDVTFTFRTIMRK